MFNTFAHAVEKRFNELSKSELFVVEADDIFDRYLAAFPAGTNPMFSTRTEHDCQTCKQFVRRLGIVVGINDCKVQTIWGGLDISGHYKVVADALDEYIRTLPIVGVFRTKEQQYGVSYNYGPDMHRYEHFKGCVDSKHHHKDADTIRSEFNSAYQVFNRGLNEIKLEDIQTVLELIDTNALYRGDEHRPTIMEFMKLLAAFNLSGRSNLFAWEHINNRTARFRNTVIGTLLTDLAEGKELDHAVKSFEQKVAPANYKRTTSIITQRMVEEAVQKLTDLGLGGAIYRRYAKLSDVNINDVLFVDNGSRAKMKGEIESLLESSIKRPTPSFKESTTITPDHFVTGVLPFAKSVQAFIENRHLGNFVSVTGSDGPERLFKWNNNFAWSYDGDVTDSVKQRVKAAGGNINADLRISLSWFNFDDLDLHCNGPYGHIYYTCKAGILDVDMNAGGGRTRTPVENLAFVKPRDGDYSIFVNQYMRRETIDTGFTIEIECQGELNQFSYSKGVIGYVDCFTFTMRNGHVTNFKTSLIGGKISQEKWGVKTETLVPVDAIMFSPNHWGDQNIGAKHLIFALQGCKNPGDTRGIYNEFLRSDLDKHRKVFEVLGAKTKCKPTEDQISGVGFTEARGDSVAVVVDGRDYTITF